MNTVNVSVPSSEMRNRVTPRCAMISPISRMTRAFAQSTALLDEVSAANFSFLTDCYSFISLFGYHMIGYRSSFFFYYDNLCADLLGQGSAQVFFGSQPLVLLKRFNKIAYVIESAA